MTQQHNGRQEPGRTAQHRLQVKTNNGLKAWLSLTQKGRRFTVDKLEVDGRPELCNLGFSPKGKGVENLDEKSDAIQCFNISTQVRVDGNVLLGSREMKAASLEELQAALAKTKLLAWNHEEV